MDDKMMMSGWGEAADWCVLEYTKVSDAPSGDDDPVYAMTRRMMLDSIADSIVELREGGWSCVGARWQTVPPGRMFGDTWTVLCILHIVEVN